MVNALLAVLAASSPLIGSNEPACTSLVPAAIGGPLKVFTDAIEKATAPTADQKTAEDAVRAKGTRDPRLVKEGTYAYLFTFDSGFRLIVRNSAGPITDAERATLQRIGGKTDVAIVP